MADYSLLCSAPRNSDVDFKLRNLNFLLSFFFVLRHDLLYTRCPYPFIISSSALRRIRCNTLRLRTHLYKFYNDDVGLL